MLVRNLTNGSLKMSSITGKRIILPSMKVIEIDELEYPAERIKKIYGRYVQILTEKVEEPKDVSTELEKDMGTKEGDGALQTNNATVTKDEKDETAGDKGSDSDADNKDDADDADDIDQLVDEVLEEIEAGTDAEKEGTAEEKQEDKPAKKATKSGKKNKKK